MKAPARSTEAGRALVVMGVSGAGKTTIARHLADDLGWQFLDADDLHPATNVAKMRSGVPLDDADREPWLMSVRNWIRSHSEQGAVVACSALKRKYRDQLRGGDRKLRETGPARALRFVHLDGPEDLIARRLESRRGHYMPPGLLASQVATLEPLDSSEGITVNVGPTPEMIVAQIKQQLSALEPGDPQEVEA